MKRKKRLSKKGKLLLGVIVVGIVIWTLIFSNSNKNITLEIHEIDNKANYTLKIDYPTLSNKKIENKVTSYIKNKKSEFLDNALKIKDISKSKCDLAITYTLHDLFQYKALYVTVYSYTGGAHYNKEIKTYYYDDKTGDEVTIKEFLEKDKFDVLANLAYYQTIKYYEDNDKNYDEEWIKEGTKAISDNYSYFNITSDGLQLYFLPYQVGPYSDGEISILISKNDLKGIVKSDYLLTEDTLVEVSDPLKRDLSKFKDKKLMAFTFDDGPSDGPTNKLLDNLEKYEARVTFFALGSRVSTYSKTLKRAYEMGNTIGSHTYSHLNLYQLNDYDIIKEINNTNEVIKKAIGVTPDKLRAPYGNTNAHIKELSDMYTILWDIDTEDWKYKDAEKIKDNIVNHAHDGAIVLLHDIYNSSVEGALLAMEELKDEYAFVSIDEMIELKNISLDKTKTHFNF